MFFCLQYFYTSETWAHRPALHLGENTSESEITAKQNKKELQSSMKSLETNFKDIKMHILHPHKS